MKRQTIFLGISLGLLVACGKQGATSSETSSELATEPSAEDTMGRLGTATLAGKVSFEGTAPRPRAINMSKDKECKAHGGHAVFDNFVVSPDGGLKWVFVYVKEGVKGRYAPPDNVVVINQEDCMYSPHVTGIMVGQTMEIRNSDSTLHNVRNMAKKNRVFNVAQPLRDMKHTLRYDSPEVMVGYKCDVHPWMASYCGVLSHPFFTATDDQGAFTIGRLPAGDYTLEAWHEELGTRSVTVAVAEGEAKTVNFTFRR